MNDILEVRHLVKRFGDVTAVDDLSFRVREGELFAFLGVNGAGKSTTIHILCGQLARDGGSVRVCGADPDEAPEQLRRSLGVVFQSSVLDQALSVQENLRSRAALYGIRGAAFSRRLAELTDLLELGELLRRWPGAQVVANAKTVPMVSQFFDCDISNRAVVVKEGDTLCTGRHTFTFLMAPMVHWPEVMVTYDAADKVLFSADAFGTFGALNGNIFADQVDFERDWLDDARRYYTNIVGKYGAQVQSLLKRAAGMEIQMICPLHGPIWRENLEWFLEKYQRWSTYTPEDRGVAIFCGSIYGHTENAAEILAARLAERGVKNIALYDVSHTDVSYLVSEAFRCSHLVLASATYNGEIYTPMENFLRDLACHGLRGRSVALIENGTWAARSGMLMTKLLEEMKEMRVMEGTVTLKSSVKEAQRRGLESLADAIADELLH